jgi:hypothetical protein
VALGMAKAVLRSITMVTLLGILSWLAMRICVVQGFLQEFFLGLKLWMDFLFWLFVLLLLLVVVLLMLMLMMMLLMLLLRL